MGKYQTTLKANNQIEIIAAQGVRQTSRSRYLLIILRRFNRPGGQNEK
jgi:hypothetical protein